MLSKIKPFLRTNHITKKAYLFLGSIKNYKKELENKKKRDALQKNGVALIHLIQQMLSREFFYFDMGTLLGIIREGRILGHDLDIDVAVHTSGQEQVFILRALLKEKGCKLLKSYSISEIGIVEDSFLINDIKFDVSYYFEKGDKDVTYLMYKDPDNPPVEGCLNVVELSCSPIKELTKIEFNGMLINVPQNSEKYLAERYGEKWRIPDKGYVYWKGPSARPTQLLAYREDFDQE